MDGENNGKGRGNGQWLRDANAVVASMWEDFTKWAGDTPPPDTKAYTERRRAFTVGAAMMHKRSTVLILQEIQKERPLTAHEAAIMEKAVTQLTRRKRWLWRWTRNEDDRIRHLIRKRQKNGPVPPYTSDEDVKRLAKRLGRTTGAVHKRMERLRAQSAARLSKRAASKRALNCPDDTRQTPPPNGCR